MASTGVSVGVECILVERTCRNVEYLYSVEIWSIRSQLAGRAHGERISIPRD